MNKNRCKGSVQIRYHANETEKLRYCRKSYKIELETKET